MAMVEKMWSKQIFVSDRGCIDAHQPLQFLLFNSFNVIDAWPRSTNRTIASNWTHIQNERKISKRVCTLSFCPVLMPPLMFFFVYHPFYQNSSLHFPPPNVSASPAPPPPTIGRLCLFNRFCAADALCMHDCGRLCGWERAYVWTGKKTKMKFENGVRTERKTLMVAKGRNRHSICISFLDICGSFKMCVQLNVILRFVERDHAVNDIETVTIQKLPQFTNSNASTVWNQHYFTWTVFLPLPSQL